MLQSKLNSFFSQNPLLTDVLSERPQASQSTWAGYLSLLKEIEQEG